MTVTESKTCQLDKHSTGNTDRDESDDDDADDNTRDDDHLLQTQIRHANLGSTLRRIHNYIAARAGRTVHRAVRA